MSVWHHLNLAQRKAALADLVNKQLAKAGVPNVSVTPKDLGPDRLGQLDFPNWAVDISQDLLSASGPLPAGKMAQLANVLYHEARHAEQWFAIARRVAGGGLPGRPLRLPVHVYNAALAKSLTANSSPQAVFGQAMHESVYGGRRPYRKDVLGRLKSSPAGSEAADLADKQYRGLPEEQDAWATGDATNGCP